MPRIYLFAGLLNYRCSFSERSFFPGCFLKPAKRLLWLLNWWLMARNPPSTINTESYENSRNIRNFTTEWITTPSIPIANTIFSTSLIILSILFISITTISTRTESDGCRDAPLKYSVRDLFFEMPCHKGQWTVVGVKRFKCNKSATNAASYLNIAHRFCKVNILLIPHDI